MAHSSPLTQLHQQAEASFLAYAPAGATPAPGDPPQRIAQVVETFGELEGEYAALRKGCVLLDLPQRGTLRVEGADRIDFLNRLVTQELKDASTARGAAPAPGLRPFHARRAFWLNRKGRIDADLRLIELPEEMLIDVDVLVAAGAASSLGSFLFSEDVRIQDATDTMHRLAVHGPTAPALLRATSEPHSGPPVADLHPGLACVVLIGGRRVVVLRDDTTGDPGLELFMSVDHVAEIYQQLLERGLDDGAGATHPAMRLRPAGWHAYNIARIEGGTPLFNLDFGPRSLPHETGVLRDRVSFTKGCYLGQEVVARMESLGHPKQHLVALRIAPPAAPPPPPLHAAVSPGARAPDAQPITGAPLIAPGDATRTPVGAITSSTRSPMLGDAIIAFAQVRWDLTTPGTELLVDTDAGWASAIVQPVLKFWSRDA